MYVCVREYVRSRLPFDCTGKVSCGGPPAELCVCVALMREGKTRRAVDVLFHGFTISASLGFMEFFVAAFAIPFSRVLRFLLFFFTSVYLPVMYFYSLHIWLGSVCMDLNRYYEYLNGSAVSIPF